MNRHLSKYGNNTITRFDIVGSFFVNLFYNEFYKKANSLKEHKIDKSTTHIYIDLLSSYSDFTERDEFFKQAVNGIHAYIISNTNQIDMTHKECIDFIVKEFIPENIFNNLRDNQKAKIFHDTIKITVREFISKIISRYIKLVIDHRNNPESSLVLQNEFLDIICIEKDKVYAKFIAPRSDRNTIPVELHKKKLNELITILNSKEKEIKQKENIIESLKKLNEKSNSVIKSLQTKIQGLMEMDARPASTKSLVRTSSNTSIASNTSRTSTTSDTLNNNNILSEDDETQKKSEHIINTSKAGNTFMKKKEHSQTKDTEEDGKSLLYDSEDTYY